MKISVRPAIRIGLRGLLLFLLGLWGCASPGVFHPVRDGQTLYRISKVYGIDEHYLARINGISDPTRLKVGDRVFIPGANQLREVPSTVSSAPPPAVSTPKPSPARVSTKPAQTVMKGNKDQPAAPAKKQPAAPPLSGTLPSAAVKPPPRTAPTTAVPVVPLAAPEFAWPLRGKVLRRFGDSGTPPSKGLEIAAVAGAKISAAAAGKVIYSGDGIRSYGNLIIIRHDDSFFTVYGYNERNLVNVGSFVSKGEKIAQAGAPPAGGSPRLYFEIRRGKDAVNPTNYLP